MMNPEITNPDYARLLERLRLESEIYWEPTRLTGPGAWTGHIATAFWLIKVAEPNIFVELGTHTGNSYSAFCQAIAHFGLSTQAFAVDTWQGDEHAGFYGESVFRDFRDFNEQHFSSFSKLLRSTFDDARPYFADGSIDLLHIDGLHTYESVKHDFELWRPALSSRAAVVFHDINVRERGFGVWRLWQELAGSYPSFAFHHSEGLGILGLGSEQSSALRSLFDLDPASKDAGMVRRIFAARGKTFQLRSAGLEEQLRLENLTNENAAQVQRGNALEGEIRALREAIEELRLENGRLAERLNKDELERRGLRQELDQERLRSEDLQRSVEQERASVAQQQDLVREAQSQRGRIETQYQELQKQHQELQTQCQELQTQQQELQKQHQQVQKQYQEAQRLCDDLRIECHTSDSRARCLEAEAEALKSQLQGVSDRLHALENTTGWRVVSHLRDALSSHPSLRRTLGGTLRWTWWTVSLESPTRLKELVRLRRQRTKILNSGLFDAAWYLAKYPDVAGSGMDPATHYLLHGAAEKRNPGPRFDGIWYAGNYTDVADSGMNPLLHYLDFGVAEGRQALPAASESRESVTAVPAKLLLDAPDESSSAPPTKGSYESWVERYDTLSAADIAAIEGHIRSLSERPLISIIMPVFNPDSSFLKEAIESVVGQIYPDWELCIADDASTNPEIATILDGFAKRDPRIKVMFRPTNGHISAASNSAIGLASGEFLALMDHDDVLPAHALYMVALEILQHSDADLIYSDEDYLDEKGRRQNPHFKPDWNQELFYSQNYINHLGVYRTSLVRKLGGFRQGFEGSQDYDLALRVIASTSPDRIRHIPHVLYHWRWAGKVDTFATANLQTAVEAAHRALRDYFRNLGRAVGVNSGATTVFNRVIREAPDPLPRVSVIIPTRDLVGLLRTCVDGLLTKTDYQNLEVVIVDNGSTDPAAVRYLEELDKSQQVTVVRIDVPFNHSMLCNSGVEHASGDLLLFLNNDIEVIEPGWLKEMVAQVVEPGVGAVGAKLYYRDDTIQHSGVVLGIGGTAGHGHRHMPRSHGGYACRLQLVQDVSCATAACLIMPRYVFEEAGRFDAEEFRVSYNDVDLCVRICRAGYRIVWTPYAELYHLEAASRGYDHEPRNAARALSEVRELRRRWSSVLTHDPMYSPNLTLRDESYGFAFPPRSLKPWLTWKTSRSREEAAQRPALESARSTIRPQERNTKNVDFRELPERIALGVSRQGNFFMTEIARILEDAFGKLGTRARIFTEAEAAAVSRDEAVLIVAPHEFFHLGEGPIAYELLRRHPYLLMLNTEQLQTTWFTVAEKYLQDATAVLDINHHSAVELSQRGFRSAALPIGYSGYIAASFDGKNLPDNQLFAHLSAREKNHLPGSYAERPIDILFVGTTSDRRSRYFAQNAAYFAGKHSFIYLPNGNRPFLRDDRRTIEFSTYAALARRSKILLTIHRDDAPYLESQRVVTLGIMQKTLVVAEQSEPLPHLVPNRDYLQGDLQCLTSLCNVALDNPDMMSEIAEKSYALLKRDCSMEDFIVKCWRHLAEQSRESESWRQTIAAGN